MADRKVLYRSGGAFPELSPVADRVRAIGMLSGGSTVTLETAGGDQAVLDDAAHTFELIGADLVVSGSSLGGVSGDTIVGDAGGFSFFTPTAPTVRGALEGVDDKLCILSKGIGVVTFTAGENLTAGQLVRISANDTVLKALATSLANARVVGVAEDAILSAAAGDITTGDGANIENAQLATGLTLAAGDEIFLSAATAGSGTNVEPTASGEVVIKVGVIKDASGYVGGTGLGAEMILHIEPPTLIA